MTTLTQKPTPKLTRAMPPPCSICGKETSQIFVALGHAIVECVPCEYRFCRDMPGGDHVETWYGDGYFSAGGAGYSNYLIERELLIRHGQRYGDILNRHTSPGRVLDVGAAAGFIAKGLADRGWQPHGLEPNSRMAQTGEDEFGFPIDCGSLESFESDAQFDAITMIQVIAHFHDLKAAMAVAASLTAPHGFWLVESWNFKSFTARAFGQNWHEYSPPSVQRWLSPRSMIRLAEGHGMQLVAKGRPKKNISGEHAKSLLQFRLEQTAVGRLLVPLTKWLPDSWPIPYPAEDLMWLLFRKSS